MLPPLLSNMACLFPQAWGWRSEKSSKQEIIEDDELLLQGGAIAPLPWRNSLLIVADPPTIHAVIGAVECADQIGLAAWLKTGSAGFSLPRQ